MLSNYKPLCQQFCALLQVVGIDVQAITLAFTACFVPALKQMNRHKPDPISTVPTFILLGSMATLAMVVQIINLTVLGHQAWFHGGTGKTQEVRIKSFLK